MLRAAGFTSVVPLMMLPTQSLIGMEAGDQTIGYRSAARVTQTLAQRNLRQHVFCEKMSEFIDDQFGCIEDTPIAALHVTIVRGYQDNRPVFAPLELISLLEDIQPRMTVLDLVKMTPEGIKHEIESRALFGLKVHSLTEDLKHLKMRLENYDLSFTASPVARLHLVNE